MKEEGEEEVEEEEEEEKEKEKKEKKKQQLQMWPKSMASSLSSSSSSSSSSGLTSCCSLIVASLDFIFKVSRLRSIGVSKAEPRQCQYPAVKYPTNTFQHISTHFSHVHISLAFREDSTRVRRQFSSVNKRTSCLFEMSLSRWILQMPQSCSTFDVSVTSRCCEVL